MSFYEIQHVLALLIPIAIIILAIYGIVVMVKNAKEKLKKVPIELKRETFQLVKIFTLVQILSLAFYTTSLINENVKIFVSLLTTILGLGIGFYFKDEDNKRNISRLAVFVGQEFFGVTMILIMVNKGLNYSLAIIFAIWSILNFFVNQQFKEKENKVFLILTIISCIIASFSSCLSKFDEAIIPLLTCIILLTMQLFCKNKNILYRFFENTLFLLLLFTFVFASKSTEVDIIVSIFSVILALVVIYRYLKNKELTLNHLKALANYIPVLVILLILPKTKYEFFDFFAISTVLALITLLSENSYFKKALVVLALYVINFSILDYVSIYISNEEVILILLSLIFSIATVLTPKKAKELVEKEVDDNEQEIN